MGLHGVGPPPDPFDPSLPSPFDHVAFLSTTCGPEAFHCWHGYQRCWCGREVIAAINESFRTCPYGWAHVGVGDEADPTGYADWLRAAREGAE